MTTRVKFETIALTLPVDFPVCLPLNSRNPKLTDRPVLMRVIDHFISSFTLSLFINHRSCLHLSFSTLPLISLHVYLPASHHLTAESKYVRKSFPSFPVIKIQPTVKNTRTQPPLISSSASAQIIHLKTVMKIFMNPRAWKKSLLPEFHGKFIFRSLSTRINPASRCEASPVPAEISFVCTSKQSLFGSHMALKS